MRPRTPAGTFAPAEEAPEADRIRETIRERLAANRRALAAGPRSATDLARATGIPRGTLAPTMAGVRPLTPELVAAVEVVLGPLLDAGSHG